MNPSLLLVIWLQTGVVLGVALLVGLLCRRTPALRLAVGRVALLTVTGLILANPWLGERPEPVVPVQWTPAVSRPIASLTIVPTPIKAAEPDNKPAPSPIDPVEAALLLYGLGALALSLRLLLGIGLLARLRIHSRRVDHAATLNLVTRAADDAGIRPPEVRTGPTVNQPFVAGTFRPTIFLAENLADEAVVRHEVAHIAQGDLRWGFFQRIVSVILWPQPLLFWLLRSMASASEELCDRQVLASGIPAPQDAACLLRLKENLRPSPVPMLSIGAISGRSVLGKRIEAILDAHRSRSVTVSRQLAWLTRAGALTVAALAAAIFAHPAAIPESTQAPTGAPQAGLLPARTIPVRLPNGQPATDFSAWLTTTGSNAVPTDRPLPVSNGKIDMPAISIPAGEVAWVFVYQRGYGVEFATMWPGSPPIKVLTLQRTQPVTGSVIVSGNPGRIDFRPTGIVRANSAARQEYGLIPVSVRPLLTARTHADGTFTLRDLPAGATVSIETTDTRFAQFGVQDRLKVPTSAPSRAQVLRLLPAGQIRGRVTRAGAPVANVSVCAQTNYSLSSNKDLWSQATTDRDGYYELRQLGRGVVNVALDLKSPLDKEVTAVAHEALRVEPGTTTDNINFDLIPGSIIRGRLLKSPGVPIPNTRVGVYGPARPWSSAWVQTAISNSEGRFELRVPAGRNRLYCMDRTYGEGRHDLVTRDGEVTVQDIVTGPGAREVERVRAEQDRQARQKTEANFPEVTGGQNFGPINLGNGISASLEYLQTDQGFMSPDGRPAPSQLEATGGITGFPKPDAEMGRLVAAIIRVTGPETGDSSGSLSLPVPAYSDSWSSTPGRPCFATIYVPPALRVTDLRATIRTGPWRIISNRIGEGPLTPALTKRRDGKQEVTVRVPDAWIGQMMNLRAFDAGGKEVPILEPLQVPLNARNIQALLRYRFAAKPAIRSVELRKRDALVATFRGVHLYRKRP